MKSWRVPRNEIPDFSKKDREICPATRFFDQLSFIGNEVVGCFVLETSEGPVLLDCMEPDPGSVEQIEQGFDHLGLDIRHLRAIVITHGHGDHYGRADYFKEKYGASLYLSKIDWQLAQTPKKGMPWDPVVLPVDHFLEDGETLSFGDTAIQAVFTPGHSPGCFSFIVPVTDEGRPHCMAMWGGSGLLADSNVQDYYQSLLKFTSVCRQYHVDGEISPHPNLDMGLLRLQMVRQIVDGVPNPFVLGEEGYHYYEQQFYQMAQRAMERKKAESGQ